MENKMDIPALLEKMVMLFLVMLVGYIAGRSGVLDETGNRVISKLTANIANPMLVLASVMTGERLMTNLEVLEVTLVAVGCYAFLIATSFLIPKLLRVKASERGLYRFMYIFSNIGFLGYPLIKALFGEGAMFHLTIFVLVFQLVTWSYGAQIITGEGRFRLHWSLLTRPSIASALLAYVIYLTGVQVPEVIAGAVTTIGDMTSPLAMLIIGCALAQCPLKAVFGRGKVYLFALIKMIVVPLVAYFVLRLFVHNELLLGITVVVFAMPVATNTTILSYEYNADQRLASAGTFLTTLLSIVTVPGLMTLLFG